MSTVNDEQHFRQCLENIIEVLCYLIQQLRPLATLENGILNLDSIVNDTSTLTLNVAEEEKMDEVRVTIEDILKKYLQNSPELYRDYLLNFLFQYDYDCDQKVFKDCLNMSSIFSFYRGFQSLLESIDAFPAARDGELSRVKDFIEKYPSFKNKSGLWGTTLLYSAARKGHIAVVKYLIEDAKCSVNAQNEQDLGKILSTSMTSFDYEAKPRAASTALHGACYNGKQEVVKYLVEHGADYFIRNQASQTPLMNIESHENVRQYFRNYLLLGYVRPLSDLPEIPILEETTRIIDCIWEYKLPSNGDWSLFSPQQSDILEKSLILEPNQEFKCEINLTTDNDIYSVSIPKFLCTSTKLDKNNVSWIRCRGSSILNFDCFSIWQIMFSTHSKAKSTSTPSLDIYHIPTTENVTFEPKLQSWYQCDEQTNAKLDDAMNMRRKLVDLTLEYISEVNLTFDLQTFSFSNNERSITGFLRWIPKLISNDELERNKIHILDNFSPMTNLNPIPLTRRHFQQVEKAHEGSLSQNDEFFEDGNGDDETPLALSNDLDDGNDAVPSANKADELFDANTWSIDDDASVDHDESADEVNDLNIDDYLDPKNDTSSQSVTKEIETVSKTEDDPKITQELLENYKKQIKELESARDRENEKKTCEFQDKLAESLERIEQLNNQLIKLKENEEKIKEIASTIRIVAYINIDKNVFHEFITPNHQSILDHLQGITKLDSYFVDKIPKMAFEVNNDTAILTFTGLPDHHAAFKEMLKTMLTSSDAKQRAIEYYQRHLRRITTSINKTLFKVQPNTKYWKRYSKLLYKLLKEENVQYLTKYVEFIGIKTLEFNESLIQGTSKSPVAVIRKATDSFMAKNPFINEIEKLKRQALDQFISLNILVQPMKVGMKNMAASVNVLKHFITKVTQAFKEDNRYIGYELKTFLHIPHLLQRLMVYYCCFTIQLPLFESSIDLLDKIRENTVITISTSAGSGKSSLLPALLAAEGYNKIFVTQPRRLPCKLICDRVNKTMTTDTSPNAEKLAGWAVSGETRNPRSKILYLTDGLFKECLLKGESFITNQTLANKSIVLFIDEVHERSVNIDLCLALIARMLTNNPGLSSKVKVIISSATLHPSVPQLFQKIGNIKFSEFTGANPGLLHEVSTFKRPSANIIDVVKELHSKRERQDQLLCFVNSVSEVNKCCRLLSEISQKTIVAYPLVQGQTSSVQQEYLQKGSVFFSTTVAETSLTFPSLKYVVDTGMIKIPVYDIQCKRTILKEVPAAESTIKQRLGRLGRTQPGEYYALYSFDPKAKPFPELQICQADLISIEFSLRKSSLKQGLGYMNQFLPEKLKPEAIHFATTELIRMGIIDENSNQFTNYGKLLEKLPDFDSLPMARCVLAALRDYKCGRDLICLASILSVLNKTDILTKIPQRYKSPDGDYMTLLNLMNEILLVKQSVPARSFQLGRVCDVKGLSHIRHIIGQALKRYDRLEKDFETLKDYSEQAQIQNGNWTSIAKALLVGYSDNVFVSKKEMQDQVHHFLRYNDAKDTAVLDLKSTLILPIDQPPAPLVIARSVLYLSSIRLTAVISFLGKLKPEWVRYNVDRQIKLNDAEVNLLRTNNVCEVARNLFHNNGTITLKNKLLLLNGTAGATLSCELYLRKQLIVEETFSLENHNHKDSAAYKNLSQNLFSLTKMTQIFNPMIRRWANQKQVTITVNSNPATKTCDITVRGRDSEIRKVEEEFKSFSGWLQPCAVIRHPKAGVTPRLLRPQVRPNCGDIEERISHVTDPKRTYVDLYNNSKGAAATRETRMEVVAWIAVCKFNCKLEGGFVRDWIVGNYVSKPDSKNLTDWIDYIPNAKGVNIPYMKKEIVPADLDCHLPSFGAFDIEKFQDELYKFDIKCQYYREDWRYILLIDKHALTGPFTMDLVESHVALTHDRIDFDVSNLVLEKNYARDLGMRIDIQRKPYSIELETIVDNIKNKQFYILRTIDGRLLERIDKMTRIRHWKQLEPTFNILPDPHFKCNVLLVHLHYTSTTYQALLSKMRMIDLNIKIKSMEEIKNPYLEEIYEGMKKVISTQCPGSNPNELKLFHGTSGDGIDGIAECGFYDRFYETDGAWGYGAYFADNPRKSHKYTRPKPSNGTRVMFYSKVLLGKVSVYPEVDRSLVSAPQNYHSVMGTKFTYKEYIVYRYGQALPYLKITYH